MQPEGFLDCRWGIFSIRLFGDRRGRRDPQGILGGCNRGMSRARGKGGLRFEVGSHGGGLGCCAWVENISGWRNGKGVSEGFSKVIWQG